MALLVAPLLFRAGLALEVGERGVQARRLVSRPLDRDRDAQHRRRDLRGPQAEAAAEEREAARCRVGVRDEERTARDPRQLEQVVRADPGLAGERTRER